MTRRLRHDQSGFTLIELLVAAGVGMVIVLASLAILDLGIKQSGKVFDREDSAQRARNAMYAITTQLRSQVCYDTNTAPIYSGSPYSVSFYTFTGSGSFAPELHTITWASNTITEKDWTGTPPNPNLAQTRTRTILTNVTPPPGTNVPVFSYWGFVTASDGSVSATSALPSTLGSSDLRNVARVTVSFTTLPQRSSTPPPATPPSTTLTQDVFSRNADPNDPNGPNAVECMT